MDKLLETKSDYVNEILKDIIFIECDFNFIIKTTGILPAFKGSLIRGAFGAELKKMCCVVPKLKTCLHCSVNDTCIYAKTFESVNIGKDKNKFLAHSTHIPHPFIIKDNTKYKTYYTEGEKFNFKLIVINKDYISKLPHYIFAFKNVFERGIKGNKRIIMQIDSVLLNLRNKEIYDIYNRETDMIDSVYKEKNMKSEEILKETDFSNRLTIEFLTPTRIGNEIKKQEIDFKTFVKSILRRLSGISAIYFNKEAKIDAKEYLKEAENVKIKDYALEIFEWHRISKRQSNKRINMSGIKGVIKYVGDGINKYLPIIKLGEYFHIGKWTGFGMGEYKVKEY